VLKRRGVVSLAWGCDERGDINVGGRGIKVAMVVKIARGWLKM
jgi:hypothetical protein